MPFVCEGERKAAAFKARSSRAERAISPREQCKSNIEDAVVSMLQSATDAASLDVAELPG
jgi:hypothetical protein